MRITRWGELGLLCCMYLARNFGEHCVGAAELAKSQALPLDYTQQILQRLRKGKIVQSTRGPHGGYSLARAPDSISLKAVLEALEGQTLELVCDSDPVYQSFCSQNRNCGVKWLWQGLKDAVDQYLESKTIATLIEEQSSRTSQQLSQSLVEIRKRR